MWNYFYIWECKSILYMEPSTLALLGLGAFVLYYLSTGATVINNLRFVENGMNFDVSNPLRITINLSILIQNPTSGSITLNSMAGTFSINGSQAGNVSFFTPTLISANSQTQITLTMTVSDINLIAIIMQYVNSGSTAVTVAINATANAGNVPLPVNLSFQPIN
jgi:LEA14-like dessication related protein